MYVNVVHYLTCTVIIMCRELCANEEAGAPDVVIEAVGLHYANTLIHKVEMALMMETDQCEVLNECLVAVKKGGRVSIVGAYAGWTNHFNVGELSFIQLVRMYIVVLLFRATASSATASSATAIRPAQCANGQISSA